MKWLKSRFIYLLIVLSLLVSTGLQVIWLQQLFLSQRKLLKDEIEHLVSTTAQKNMFFSMTSAVKPGNRQQVSQFFLSPQWENLREAFEGTKMDGVTSSLSVDIGKDSSTVRMFLTLTDAAKKSVHPPSTRTSAQTDSIDRVSLAEMKKQVEIGLRGIGISPPVYYTIFDNHHAGRYTTNVPDDVIPAYSSAKYIYNVQKIHRYQLNLPAINALVWYRMRFYLASCVLMLVLTIAAFYFILRLLRRQQLYAQAKSNFTSNMTHEFKTPIATVSVAIESINKYNLINEPATLQKYLDISQHELRRLDLMVEKVLNISNENDIDHSLNFELYDVQVGISQVVASMALQLQHNNGSIHFTPSKEPCFVMGDAVHLTNLFYNLIDNAIKYTGDNLKLEISCRSDAGHIVINFKDNGPGIDRIYHKDIFERFFRVPAIGDTHNVKGFGLGLNYVKQVAEKHGGKIKLRSEPGHGCDFILTLPAAS